MSAPERPCIEDVVRLVRAFEDIVETRMAGLPMLNSALRVQAVGFEPMEDGHERGWVGILITPWFMNLTWLPQHSATTLPVGESRTRTIGNHCFEFIGGYAQGAGTYEACSLFSPMFEFIDQLAATATAQSVLELLRKPAARSVEPNPGRRAFLLGRASSKESS